MANKINHHLTMKPRMVAPVSRDFYGRHWGLWQFAAVKVTG
jgi:hypothetical protein